MTQKILLVDDEPNVLQAFRRNLRGRYDLAMAVGGAEALSVLAAEGPFAVVVSDMQMPTMNGLELLRRVREHDSRIVRIMLTGNADQQTTIDAVNFGRIFRFLSKPVSAEVLSATLDEALEQYRRISVETELMGQTLQGAVKLVTDVLGLVRPDAFGASQGARRLAAAIADRMGVDPPWVIELAAMLANIGWIALPENVIQDYLRGEAMSLECRKQFDQHPQIGAKLIENIPRLQGVAEIVAKQMLPPTTATPIGARILRVVNEYQRLTSRFPVASVLERLRSAKALYDPLIVEHLAAVTTGQVVQVAIGLEDLKVGMVLADTVQTLAGDVLLRADMELTDVAIERIRNFARSRGVKLPIQIRSVANPEPMPAGPTADLPLPTMELAAQSVF